MDTVVFASISLPRHSASQLSLPPKLLRCHVLRDATLPSSPVVASHGLTVAANVLYITAGVLNT